VVLPIANKKTPTIRKADDNLRAEPKVTLPNRARVQVPTVANKKQKAWQNKKIGVWQAPQRQTSEK
jgi:hypothetical protein